MASFLARRSGLTRVFWLLLFCLSLRAQAAIASSLPTITWDPGTLRLIERGGDYGRMIRLLDGRIACVYDRGRKMWIRHSHDEGATWQEPILVAEEPACWLTNADLLPLRDGSLLYFWNERPVAAVEHQHREAPPGLLPRPFRIRMARSADHGRSWSAPQTLYTAGMLFRDGCWEPAGLQLPSGEVQVYFANESPYRTTDEQEITLLRSHDNGRTWSPGQRVAMRPGHRDGMPAPLLLASGRGIVVAIEDNGLAGGRFKPAVVRTSLEDNWRSGPIGGDSAKRSGALAEPLDPRWYGGAPCLRQLPAGPTLLSYQESPDGSLARCRMAVCVGDRDARGFTHKTYPFSMRTEGNQLWNSLLVKDARIVTAISNARLNGVRGIWSIDGRISAAPATSTPAHDIR